MFARIFVGASITLAALLAAGQPAGAASRTLQPPGVRIWTNHGEAYQPTERVRIFFRTERDAYVTVLRVDTHGRVQVLFPSKPGDAVLARGGETYTVAGVDDRDAFIADDPPGVGYLFAVASQDPFAYDAFTENDHWALETISDLGDGRIHGDPYTSLQDLVRQIMPQGYADYDTQLLPYDVARRPDNAALALAAPPAAEPPSAEQPSAPHPYLEPPSAEQLSGAPPPPEPPAAAQPHPEPPSAGQPAPADSGARQPPGVRIWTDHGEAYQPNERVQVFFRTERDAYVTVLRVDTDGRVRVLFPREPGDPNLTHGGETYTVPGVDGRDAFTVDDPPGLGYVFAVASLDPFVYDHFTENDQWSLEAIAGLSDGRIHGDPNASLQELAQQMMFTGYTDYDTQLLAYDVVQQDVASADAPAAPLAPADSRARQEPYYVEPRDDGYYSAPAAPYALEPPAYGAYRPQYAVAPRHDYPRFLCYDCHAYTPYAYWNPYSAWCPQFSLAVYYNPFYSSPGYSYPARYYGGTRVVYVRPGGLAGRQYVFKPRAEQAAPYAFYRDRAGEGMRQPLGRGVRGVDVGGVGSIPAPGGRRTLGGSSGQAWGGAAARRQYIRGSRQEIARAQPPRRGGYIDPGTRDKSARSPTALGRPYRREGPRYIPQAAPREGSRGTPGYGASPAPRSGYAPQGSGYADPGTRQRSARPPAASVRPYQRESPRYSPQAAPVRPYQREGPRYTPQPAPRQGSRGAPDYGASRGWRGAPGEGAQRGSPGIRSYGGSQAPRSGFAPRGGGPGSSGSGARAAPRSAPAPRAAPGEVRRRSR